MKKGSFILYDSDLQGVLLLTVHQAGKLLKALAKYRLEGIESDFGNDVAVAILYRQIIDHIAINEEKYNEACKKRSETMKKKWNERKNTENGSTLYSTIDKSSDSYIYDNDNYNENDIDNVNDNDACGAKRENKRKNYYNKKNNVPALLRDEPSYDIDAFTRKAIGIKYEKKDSAQ